MWQLGGLMTEKSTQLLTVGKGMQHNIRVDALQRRPEYVAVVLIIIRQNDTPYSSVHWFVRLPEAYTAPYGFAIYKDTQC